jgi:hypothetical protein
VVRVEEFVLDGLILKRLVFLRKSRVALRLWTLLAPLSSHNVPDAFVLHSLAGLSGVVYLGYLERRLVVKPVIPPFVLPQPGCCGDFPLL